MIIENRCPYCNHEFISNTMKAEFLRIKILKLIQKSNLNMFNIAKNLNIAIGGSVDIAHELIKKNLLKREKYNTKSGGRAYKLNLTSKAKKLLEDLG